MRIKVNYKDLPKFLWDNDLAVIPTKKLMKTYGEDQEYGFPTAIGGLFHVMYEDYEILAVFDDSSDNIHFSDKLSNKNIYVGSRTSCDDYLIFELKEHEAVYQLLRLYDGLDLHLYDKSEPLENKLRDYIDDVAKQDEINITYKEFITKLCKKLIDYVA